MNKSPIANTEKRPIRWRGASRARCSLPLCTLVLASGPVVVAQKVTEILLKAHMAPADEGRASLRTLISRVWLEDAAGQLGQAGEQARESTVSQEAGESKQKIGGCVANLAWAETWIGAGRVQVLSLDLEQDPQWCHGKYAVYDLLSGLVNARSAARSACHSIAAVGKFDCASGGCGG